MARPKFFRDPVHVQLRFAPVDLTAPIPQEGGDNRRSWLLRKLIDCPEFQRLRFIRQNGLANYVFHGAEHSRFTHSLGVAHLAGEMYDRIARNMGEKVDEDIKTETMVAALLHDIGHGPFSHTLEEILRASGIEFDHEVMTIRFIEEQENEVGRIVRELDDEAPARLSKYIDKKRRRGQETWQYKLVSSQLDADRLDYTMRDSMFAGLKGQGYDLPRLLDLLHHKENKLAVERGAIAAVEAYLITLDHLYRSIYYHHAVRAANRLLTSIFRRAFTLHADGDVSIFPNLIGDRRHPLALLAEHGQKIDLESYARLGEHQAWTLIDYWKDHNDPILKDLSERLLSRRLFKAKEVNIQKWNATQELVDRAKQMTIDRIGHVGPNTVDYYVGVDEPTRTSYKRYDWSPEGAEDSIWMIGEDRDPSPIEDESESKIVLALKETTYFHRLIFPAELKGEL